MSLHLSDVYIKYSPANIYSFHEVGRKTKLARLYDDLVNWTKIIVAYGEESPMYEDDHIMMQHYNTYTSYFEINDGSENNLITPPESSILIPFYEELTEKVNSFEEFTVDEKDQIKDLVDKNVKEISDQPKKIVVKSLNKVFALIRKTSAKAADTIFSQFIKSISKGVFQNYLKLPEETKMIIESVLN